MSAKSATTTAVDDEFDSPGEQFLSLFQSMQDLNDKLLALDYSKEFVSTFKCPPINRYFFCKKTNQAQQFFTFCCLSSYIVNKVSGKSDLKVDSFDDPNLIIEKILAAAQKHIDVSGYTKNKFKQGYGAEVIDFLSKLADQYCLQNRDSIQSGQIVISFVSNDGVKLDSGDDDNEDDDDNDDDNEIELEEEFGDYIITEGDNLEEDGWEDIVSDEEDRKMIVANTDVTEWKLELERILPQLNARFMGQTLYKSGDYDNEWRLHHQAAVSHHSNIKNTFVQTENLIRNLTNDLRSSLEKIHSKENYLHQNLNTILAEWANVRERALKLRQTFEKLNSEVQEKSERLQQLTEEDKFTKQSIEEYSLSMTDSSPLVEAKKARESLKADLVKVNLQIGVAIQTLVKLVTLHTSSYLYWILCSNIRTLTSGGSIIRWRHRWPTCISDCSQQNKQ